ncbi:MAG: hypothetical protein KDC38_18720 [Planctomycetes bacterium]|nr:hypothetical protein [Planctomycetota bacterium]
MDAQLSPTFKKALPTIVGQIANDTAQLLGIEFSIDAEQVELRMLEEIHPGDGSSGVVCGRAVFVRKASGTGGVLLRETTAQRLAHAAMMMDPPSEEDPFDWEGLVRDAMDEIFNILVGTWNNVSPADSRMASAVNDRSVDWFRAGTALPPEAGVLPVIAWLPMKIGEVEDHIAFFLPVGSIHGRAVAGFSAPDHFTKDLTAVPAAPATAVAPAPSAPQPQPQRTGPVQPVVFVDYTGTIVQWIRAASSKNRLYKHSGPQPTGASPPAATVLVGIDPATLEQLANVPFVEIRRE